MNTIKINITFLLARNRLNQSGKCSIRCRITYLKKRHEFATGLFLNPNYWHSRQQLAKPPNAENTFINNELSLIKNKINQAFLLLQIQERDFTAEDVYNQFRGKTQIKNKSLVEYYNEYLVMYKKLIGIEIKKSTWNKFNYILSDIKDFIKCKFNLKDVLLKDLDLSFIIDFEYYLKTEKHQKQVTVNKALQRLKKVVKSAVINKYLDSFPFEEHRAKKVVTNVVYLTVEELEKLESYTFSQTRLEQVKDMFIFCCYTGLAYNEMNNLQKKHIVKGFDGNDWIKMVRDKTQRLISIPLLHQSKRILDKYNTLNERYSLPRISNQKFNSYLKEIAHILGIEDKRLTHHIARKTFASTVLLYNDVPMEIVSELLGHSKISITQEHYGKITQKKVSEHIFKLNKKLT
jgi:integrase